jgi:hypothetical protein
VGGDTSNVNAHIGPTSLLLYTTLVKRLLDIRLPSIFLTQQLHMLHIVAVTLLLAAVAANSLQSWIWRESL